MMIDVGNKNDAFHELKSGSVKYKGVTDYLNRFIEKEQLSDDKLWNEFIRQYTFNSDDDYTWRGEFWGKMMRGACLTYQYTRDEKLLSELERVARKMLATQQENGRFSTYSVKLEFTAWDLWCRKYVMLGFLYYLEICPDESLREQIITALKRHADYILQFVGEGKKKITDCSYTFEGMNSCSILEPFMKLYFVTGEQRYLDFARHIVSTGFIGSQNIIELAYTKEKKPYEFKFQKAYEMMSCFQGLLYFYKATKEEKYLVATMNFFDMVAKTELTEIGALGCQYENFYNSTETQTEYMKGPGLETCVTVTWMNCCYQLLCYTGDSKYADFIEQSAINALLGAVNTEKNEKVFKWYLEQPAALNAKGLFLPFNSYSPLVKKERAIDIGGSRLLNDEGQFYGCCTCIGSMGTALSALYGVLEDKGGYVINSYEAATYNLKTPSGKNFVIEADGDLYNGDGTIKLLFKMPAKEKLNLKLRIPCWSEKTECFVNGKAYATQSGTYCQVEELFGDQSEIILKFDNDFKLVKRNGKTLVRKGPVVLARDERYHDGFDEPVEIATDENGKIHAVAIKTGMFKTLLEYEIPTKNGKTIKMCDYGSAGKSWDSGIDTRISAWL